MPSTFQDYWPAAPKTERENRQSTLSMGVFSQSWSSSVRGAMPYRGISSCSLRIPMRWGSTATTSSFPHPHSINNSRVDKEEDTEKEVGRTTEEENCIAHQHQPKPFTGNDVLVNTSPAPGVSHFSFQSSALSSSNCESPPLSSHTPLHFTKGASIEFSRIHPINIDTSASSVAKKWLKDHPNPDVSHDFTETQKSMVGKGGLKPTSITPEGVQCYDIKGTTWKRAVLPLCIFEKGIKTKAIGQSKKKKQAEMLCYMHAVQLIQFYSTLPEHSDSTVTQDTRFSPSPPLPLIVLENQSIPAGSEASFEENQNPKSSLCLGRSEPSNPSIASPASEQKFLSPNFPLSTVSLDSPSPSLGNSSTVNSRSSQRDHLACAYLSTSEQERLQYLARMDIPPSPNPLVNEASDRIRQEGKEVNPHALHALNECIPGASADLKAVKVLPNVHVVQYPIDTENHLIAVGVASKAKAAKVRCAAHAMHILSIYKKQHNKQIQEVKRSISLGVKGNVVTINEGAVLQNTPFTGSLSSRPTETISMGSLLRSLPGHNQILLEFMYYCFGIKPIRHFCQPSHVTSSKAGKKSVSRTEVSCSVTIGGVTCKGMGMNNFEAERRAISNAISELQFCDDRVAALHTFISCHSHLTPDRLPRAQLPKSVQDRIAALLVEEGKVFSSEEGQYSSSSQEEVRLDAQNKMTSEEEMFVRALSRNSTQGRNKAWAEKMRQSLSALRTNPTYLQEFFPRRSTLPIAAVRELLLSTVRNHRVTVIAGTTGCGKTTQVPQYLLDEAIEMGMGDLCNILVTQSRRLSTFNVASRIASERLEVVGKSVGYAVRLETIAGRHINICTSGVLLQILVKHPLLDHITHLVLDEVHDRDINCDVILAVVKTILKVNQNIRIILMSATIEASLFSSYFDGAPVIQIDGAAFPFSVYHLEDIQTILQQENSPTGSTENTYGNTQVYSPCANQQRGAHAASEGRKLGEIVEEDSFLRSLATKRRGDHVGGIEGGDRAKGINSDAFSKAKESELPPIPPKNVDYDLIAQLVYYSEKTHLRPIASKASIPFKNSHSSSVSPGTNANRFSSILIFLPGWKELMAAKHAIERYRYRIEDSSSFSSRKPTDGVPLPHIILLHSSVTNEQQRACFLPPPPGHFKVVLATNIAESGITIDDVAVVIDTGLIKETDWRDHNTALPTPHKQGMQKRDMSFSSSDEEEIETGAQQGERKKYKKGNYTSSIDSVASTSVMTTQLTLKYASRANCTQRTGRAGRTQGGVCYRLFPKRVELLMRNFPEAEIFRVPLSQVILKCLSLGHSLSFLQELIEPPHQRNVMVSMHQLVSLGAVSKEEKLTPLGLYLSRLPCDPRMGKLIIMGAVLRCLDSALTIAASTDASPFVTSREVSSEVKKQRYILSRSTQSDPVTSLNAYNAVCANEGNEMFVQHNYLDLKQLKTISQYKQQYKDILSYSGFIISPEKEIRCCSSDLRVVSDRDGVNMGIPADLTPACSVHCTPTSDTTQSHHRSNYTATHSTSSSTTVNPLEKIENNISGKYDNPQSGEWDTPPVEAMSGEHGAECRRGGSRDGILVGGKYFVDTSIYATHSLDVALVKACIASCLFPNIAVVNVDNWIKQKEKKKGGRKITLRTRTIPNVKPGSSSVCRYVSGTPPSSSTEGSAAEYLSLISSSSLSTDNLSRSSLPSFFYVFQDIFRVAHSPSVQVQFLREVSGVSLWALLLFCGSTESFMTYHELLGIGIVDNWIGVYLDKATYTALCTLRQILERCLRRKFRNPRDQQNNNFLDCVQELCREILHLSPQRKKNDSSLSSFFESGNSSKDHHQNIKIDPDGDKCDTINLPASAIDFSLVQLVDSGSIVPPIRESLRNQTK